MKKIILTIMTVMAFISVKAQDEGFAKGDKFISGTVAFNSTEQDLVKSDGFTISPKFGYFVSENISIGLQLGYTSQKAEDVTSNVETKTNTTNLGAFGRYYFSPSNKFSIFGELGLGYLSSKIEVGNADVTLDGIGASAGPGVSYFLNKNFALEANWGVINYTSLNSDLVDTNSFSIGVNLSDINFGLIYKF